MGDAYSDYYRDVRLGEEFEKFLQTLADYLSGNGDEAARNSLVSQSAHICNDCGHQWWLEPLPTEPGYINLGTIWDESHCRQAFTEHLSALKRNDENHWVRLLADSSKNAPVFCRLMTISPFYGCRLQFKRAGRHEGQAMASCLIIRPDGTERQILFPYARAFNLTDYVSPR